MAVIDNLIAFWELEEASGTRIDQHSSNDLTDNNTVEQGTGKVGNCASFTTTNEEYLSSASNSDLQTGDIDFYISGWVQLTNKSSDHWFASKWSHGTIADREFLFRYHSGSDRFQFFWYPSGDSPVTINADTFGSPSVGTWYFVEGWRNQTTGEIGIAVNRGTGDTNTGANNGVSSTAPFHMGAFVRSDSTIGGALQGLLDQWGIWKRVLTSTERDELYNSGAGVAYADFAAAPSATLNLPEEGGVYGPEDLVHCRVTVDPAGKTASGVQMHQDGASWFALADDGVAPDDVAGDDVWNGEEVL